MSALLLAAVHCARVQPSIALAANHLLTIEPGAAAQIPWSKVSSPKSVECHHWAVTLKGCGICIPNPCHPVHTSHVSKNFGSVGDTGGHSQIRARFLAYLLDCLSIIIDHPFLGNYPWLSPKNSWPQRLSRQHRQWGFNDTAAETQHQVEGGLLDRRDGWDPEGSRAPLDEALHGAGRFTNIVLPPNHASLSLSHHVCLMFFVSSVHGAYMGCWGKEIQQQNTSIENCQHRQQILLLLDVVIAESSPILQLFASEDQALLVRRDTCAKHVASGQPAYPSSSFHSCGIHLSDVSWTKRNPINISWVHKINQTLH